MKALEKYLYEYIQNEKYKRDLDICAKFFYLIQIDKYQNGITDNILWLDELWWRTINIENVIIDGDLNSIRGG